MWQTRQPRKLSHITLWPLDLAFKWSAGYVIVQRRSLAGICVSFSDGNPLVHENELRRQTVSVASHVKLVVNLNNLPKMDANKLYTPPRLFSFEVSLWFHIHDQYYCHGPRASQIIRNCPSSQPTRWLGKELLQVG